jgi:hypothetical protein
VRTNVTFLLDDGVVGVRSVLGCVVRAIEREGMCLNCVLHQSTTRTRTSSEPLSRS